MSDREKELLMQLLDETLPAEQRPEVDRIVAGSPEARRFVAEHRAVWRAVGEAYAGQGRQAPEPAGFSERVVETVLATERSRGRPRWAASLAAAVLLGVSIMVWLSSREPGYPPIEPADRDLVRYLHVLQHLELVQEYGEELDLLGELEVLRAFEGELENEG